MEDAMLKDDIMSALEWEPDIDFATAGVCDAHCPPQIASKTSTNPIADVSSTRPGRSCRRYTPISSAIGIVIAIVKAPQGLCFSALTTINAHTASRMTRIAMTDA